MILGVTAHRLDKLALAAYQLHVIEHITQTLEEKVDWLLSCLWQPKRVLTGMAVGGDQLVARVCLKHAIPFVAYVPCDRQQRLWPVEAQREYLRLLDAADSVIRVSAGPYTSAKMQLRNEKIVDDCTDLFAIHNGSKGGTFNTVRYALEQHRHTYRLNPCTLELAEW